MPSLPLSGLPAFPGSSPTVACVVVHYRLLEETFACLASLRAHGNGMLKIFLVDNSSEDGSGETLQSWLRGSGLKFNYLDTGENLGFAGGCNVGIQAALDEGLAHVMLLNNDAVIDPGFGEALRRALAEDGDSVIAGTVLEHADGRPSYNVGRIHPLFHRLRFEFDPPAGFRPDFVSGCFMVVPARVFAKTGLFDDRFFMYAEDFDLSLRLRSTGAAIRLHPELVVRHKSNSSAKKSRVPIHYYLVRNQTYSVLRHAPLAGRAAYLLLLAAMVAHRFVFRPSVAMQVAHGAWDGLRGRLGKNHREAAR